MKLLKTTTTINVFPPVKPLCLEIPFFCKCIYMYIISKDFVILNCLGFSLLEILSIFSIRHPPMATTSLEQHLSTTNTFSQFRMCLIL